MQRFIKENENHITIRRLKNNQPVTEKDIAEFLNDSPLLPDQISFLDEVINYLISNGVMEPKVMFENPFTNLHDHGVAGIFDNNASKRIINLIENINGNAETS